MKEDFIKYFIIFCCSIMSLVFVIGFFGIKYFKGSEPYKVAVDDAYNNPKVQAETGKIIGIGFMVAGELKSSSADLTFTVLGEKRNLKVYYTLDKSIEGDWVVKEVSW